MAAPTTSSSGSPAPPLQVRPAPDETDETASTTAEPYDVLLWNDPVTLMEVVVRILQKVFGYDVDKAELLMITAHLEGKVVVWTGDRDRARHYCLRLGTHGLQASVAKGG